MLAIMVALALGQASMPTYPTLPPDLARAAEAFDMAQVKGDRTALTELLADDYLLANSSGQLENKAEFIKDYITPGFTFAPFTIEQPVQQVWDTGAVLGGVVDAKGMSDGKPYMVRMRFADVWAKRNGQWQVIFTQANRVAPAQ